MTNLNEEQTTEKDKNAAYERENMLRLAVQYAMTRTDELKGNYVNVRIDIGFQHAEVHYSTSDTPLDYFNIHNFDMKEILKATLVELKVAHKKLSRVQEAIK